LEQDEFDLLGNGLYSKIVEDDKLCFFQEIEPFDAFSVLVGILVIFSPKLSIYDTTKEAHDRACTAQGLPSGD